MDNLQATPMQQPEKRLALRSHCGPLALLFSTILPGIALIFLVRAQFPAIVEAEADYPPYYDYGYDYYGNATRALIEGKEHRLWAVLIAITLLAAGYFLYALLRKRRVANPAWIINSFLFCGWMTMLFTSLYDGFSMSTTAPLIIICALCVIPIFFSMIRVVIWLSPMDKSQSIGKTLLPFMAIPILWYLITNTLRYASAGYTNTVILLLALVTTYCFVMILLRVLYLLAFRRDSSWKTTRIVILFVLPLLGLMVTQMAPQFSFFWDFSSPLYYLLVIANGVLMLLPEPSRPFLRIALFGGRCCTYVFVLYFFVCLAPFYPLPFIGILVFGLGLLVLAPLFLFIYQSKALAASGKELFFSLGKVRTVLALLLGVCVLPLCVVISFAQNKGNFETALTYLSAEESAASSERVDIPVLERSIEYVQQDGAQLRFTYDRPYYNMDSINRPPPPILTQLHNRIMAAEEPLQDGSLYSGLRSVFFHEQTELTGYRGRADLNSDPRISIQDIEVETREQDGAYRSTVHLTLKRTPRVQQEDDPLADYAPYQELLGEEDNYDELASHWDERDLSQYSTAFRLPDGVFISDYYLDVLGTRKSGILSERSSALWIYNEVVSRSLDPGLVYYSGDDIVLRVFPFANDEVRYTGIEFLHNGPASITIDGREISLAPEALSPTEPVYSDNGAVYVSAAAKEQLPLTTRAPEYHFVVDCSLPYDIDYYENNGEDYTVQPLIDRIKEYCSEQNIAAADAVVHALNYRRRSWRMSEGGWERKLLRYPVEGGFNFAAAAQAIAAECESPRMYPVVIVVTNDLERTMLPADTAYMARRSPELDGYYTLQEGTPMICPFTETYTRSAFPGPTASPQMRLLQAEGQVLYLRDNGEPEIVLAPDSQAEAEQYPSGYDYSDGSWKTALQLMGDYERSFLYPEDERKSAQIEVVKSSFRSGVMSPLSSFIVLETAEQERLMLERQRKLLESGDLDSYIPMDFDNGEGMGSEPPMLLCIAVLLPVIFLLHRRRRRTQAGVECQAA